MNLTLKIGFTLLLLAIGLRGISQIKSNNIALTLDIAGNSGFYSVNGEYQIGKIKDYNLNARLGLGYYPISNTQFITVPIGLNMLLGKKKHHLELGLGASYIKGNHNFFFPAGTYGITQDRMQASEGIYFVPSIGYRFDKLTGGLILKLYYSPLITVYDFFDKEKFLNELIPILYGNWTKEEYYNHSTGTTNAYPTAKSQFGNFGISVGYRF